jgi:predicted RNA-binding protein with PIN domain
VLIIDAYNVLHAAGKVHEGLGGLTLPRLVGLIQAGRWSGGPVMLICDGTGTRTGIDESLCHPEAPIRVVFAGPGRDADSAIERLIEDQERKGRAGATTIVSSDKRVLASAIGPIGAKARRMTSERFVRVFLEDAARSSTPAATPKPEALDRDSVAHWLRRFGIDPTESPHRAAAGPNPSPPPALETPAQDWPDGIDPDDLDMGKWLKG